jgi:hypothetical protein
MHRISERGPMQHGNSDVGFRLDPRTVKLVLGVDPTTLGDQYTRRATLLSLFGPRTAAIPVRWTLPDGSYRQLDCHYLGDMRFETRAGEGYLLKVAVTLGANDPSFYDPTGAALTFALGGGAGTFAVPTPVPTDVGASTIDQSTALTYAGSWLCYPHLVRITGPITDAVVTNSTTGDKLDFTGTTIAAGDHYDIDCRYGRKTVVDAAGANQIATLTTDSDLATWHISADPDVAPGGINSIRVTGSAASTATKVEISYYNRYLGI